MYRVDKGLKWDKDFKENKDVLNTDGSHVLYSSVT